MAFQANQNFVEFFLKQSKMKHAEQSLCEIPNWPKPGPAWKVHSRGHGHTQRQKWITHNTRKNERPVTARASPWIPCSNVKFLGNFFIYLKNPDYLFSLPRVISYPSKPPPPILFTDRKPSLSYYPKHRSPSTSVPASFIWNTNGS